MGYPRRHLVSLLGSILAVLAAMAPVSRAGELCRPSQIENIPGWTSIPVPEETNNNNIVYAVDPIDPSRIFYTEGSSVSKSVDGGCNWETVLELPVDVSFRAQISSIVTGTSAATHNVVALGLSGPTLVDVLVSKDGGATWPQHAPSPTSKLGQGRLASLAIAPSDPKRIYASVQHTTVSPAFAPEAELTSFFRSDDGGTSWTATETRTRFGTVPAGGGSGVRPALEQLSVSPIDPDLLFGLTPYQLPIRPNPVPPYPLPGNTWSGQRYTAYLFRIATSRDGGKTWSEIPGAPDPVNNLAVAWNPDGSATLGASMPYGGKPRTVWTSSDSGKTWRSLPELPEFPVPPSDAELSAGDSAATGVVIASKGGVVVMLQNAYRTAEGTRIQQTDGIWRYSPGLGRWLQITPVPVGLCDGGRDANSADCRLELRDLKIDAARRQGVYFSKIYNGGDYQILWRYTGSLR